MPVPHARCIPGVATVLRARCIPLFAAIPVPDVRCIPVFAAVPRVRCIPLFAAIPVPHVRCIPRFAAIPMPHVRCIPVVAAVPHMRCIRFGLSGAMAYVLKDDLIAIAVALNVPGNVKEAAGSEVLMAIQRLLKTDRQSSNFVSSERSNNHIA